MKRIKLLSVLFLALAATTFTSCGDTEPVDPVLTQPGDGETPAGPAVFKVDFSGQTYVATATTAVIGQGLISVQGVKGTNGQAVSIVVEGTTTGTYSGEVAVMDYNPGNNSGYSYSNMFVTGTNAGSVTISSIDTVNKTISGTFNFIGEWTDMEANLPSVAFTNGSFENIPYTGTAGGGIPNPVGDEFFKATVDGSEFSYAEADLAVAVGDGNPNIVTINAINANHAFNIGFPDTITAGTYTFAVGASATTTAGFTDAEGVHYNVTGGSLIITSNTGGWVTGSFEFTVVGENGTTVLHTVSAGTFNVEWDF